LLGREERKYKIRWGMSWDWSPEPQRVSAPKFPERWPQ